MRLGCQAKLLIDKSKNHTHTKNPFTHTHTHTYMYWLGLLIFVFAWQTIARECQWSEKLLPFYWIARGSNAVQKVYAAIEWLLFGLFTHRDWKKSLEVTLFDAYNATEGYFRLSEDSRESIARRFCHWDHAPREHTSIRVPERYASSVLECMKSPVSEQTLAEANRIARECYARLLASRPRERDPRDLVIVRTCIYHDVQRARALLSKAIRRNASDQVREIVMLCPRVLFIENEKMHPLEEAHSRGSARLVKSVLIYWTCLLSKEDGQLCPIYMDPRYRRVVPKLHGHIKLRDYDHLLARGAFDAIENSLQRLN